ncbi:glycerophosphodiester phosphodiesterase [Anaerocolumna aminovalerica]|uniref:glycerophosphodiester phosphodiesterase n=1 Tax=Anaerocolumna aminovalerica TaxID=1527 RepID=UPI00248C3110|nr:glycerophosphodiester phosphodiesterase family protein [Anaerocolumna aminovalerica]
MMWKQSENNILVVGHRGVKAFYPENTMLSFRKAIELGVDGLEMDINMTKDGHLVVIHDNTVDRTTNGTGKVADFNMSEIKELDAGSHFSPEYAGERIPAFEEFLELVKNKKLLLNVEIKDYRTCVIDKTIKILEEYKLTDTYVITCFDANVTTYAHKKYGVKTQGFPRWLVKNYNEESNSHYYSVGIGMKDLTRELCDKYKELNIDPWCWCPDDEENVLRAIECGSTLVTVNNPIPALTILKAKNLHQ